MADFLINKFAKCECDLSGHPPAEFPICTFFENVPDDDCDDACKECRHGERCHLKGHQPTEVQQQGETP